MRKQSVSAKANRDFIDLVSLSGYRLAVIDPASGHYHFASDVSDEELGRAVRAALDNSRFLALAEATQLRSAAASSYERWVASLIDIHRYKNRRALFEDMRSCRIERGEDAITFFPLVHEQMEGWSGDGVSPEDNVNIATDTTNAEIGAALRTAFARCR